jgi:lipopolysaccharide/colanic/teichoic acid biosynthesis glycosyltransferase
VTQPRRYYATKRAFDFTVASITLVFALPVLALLAILIKLDTRGPVVFRQERLRGRRVMRNGQAEWELATFTIFKLRTMVTGADTDTHKEYMTAYINGDEAHFAANRTDRQPGDSYRPERDPRVTRIGRVLRMLSLDELPQLWNVLRGDMSLVGPRPPMPYEAELYTTRDLQRLATPGGMTGWTQVKGRCTVDFQEMVDLDLEYVERQSFWFDVSVLLRTIPVVVSRKGAG